MRVFGTYLRAASTARGVKIRTRKRMMNGSPGGSPDNDGTCATYLVASDPRMPMIRPPI